MNRRMILAALTLIGAASVAVAPSFAQQQQSLMDAKMATENAPKSSGAMPLPSLQLGTKGAATTESAPHAYAGRGVAAPVSPALVGHQSKIVEVPLRKARGLYTAALEIEPTLHNETSVIHGHPVRD